MKYDVVENFQKCLIQHGNLNQRIYLMKWGDNNEPGFIDELEKFALERGYSKIFAKIPQYCWPLFKQKGYVEEARIPDFFEVKNDCLFIAKYFDDRRKINQKAEQTEAVLEIALKKKNRRVMRKIKGVEFRKAICADAGKISELYRKVFASYPFPIFEPVYIEKTMKTHIDYYVAADGADIVAASSAEKDTDSRSVEMTDFATLPRYRNRGMAGRLLRLMEEDMRKEQMRTLYTIARALSKGMNITFSTAGYVYGGVLVNNTYIAGAIENMNVWYKHVEKQLL